MRKEMIVAFVSCAAASATQADCVTTSDLIPGVVVRYDNGTIETHRQSGRERIVIEEASTNGSVFRWTLAKGVYHIEHSRKDDGQAPQNLVYKINYGLPLQDLPFPRPGHVWEASTTMHLPPDPPFRQKEVYFFGQLGTLELVDCAYEVIPIESRATAQGDVDIVGMLFLPQIGTSLTIELNGENWRQPVSLVAIGR